ncbi:hypothetical protein VCSRO103_2005 [Vibrio cholerae]|nr:hypothetical protein [Vibrio cholerae]GHW66775.1 hypothetical protein VCSRO103_2005 [Vibrio cholerae]
MLSSHLNKAALVAASLILISGCSYRPPLVTANIPLISESALAKTADACLTALPDSLEIGATLHLDCTEPATYQVSEVYTSALGNRCAVLFSEQRELTLCNEISGQQIQWFRVQSVMSGM